MDLRLLILLCISVFSDYDVSATETFSEDIKDSIISQIKSLKTKIIERGASLEHKLNIIENKLSNVEDRDNMYTKKFLAVEEELNEAATREKSYEVKLNEVESKVRDADERLTSAEDALTFFMSDNAEMVNHLFENDVKREIIPAFANRSVDSAVKLQSKNKVSDIPKVAGARVKGARSFTLKPTPTVVPTTVPTGSNNVAFTVFLSKDVVNLHFGLIIAFDQVLINEGQGFNTGTHTFVCPVNGDYLFQSALYTSFNERVEAEIVKENVMLARLYAAGTYDGTSRLDQGFNSCIVQCNKGEGVWVRIYTADHNSEIASSKYSTFSGLLLWAY